MKSSKFERATKEEIPFEAATPLITRECEHRDGRRDDTYWDVFFFLEKSKSPTIRSGRRGPWGTGSRGIGKGWRRYRWTMVEAAASILSSPLSPSSSSTTLSSSGRLLHVAIAYSQPCHYHEAILHAG